MGCMLHFVKMFRWVPLLFSLSQDKTSFQNSEDTLQRESKCSKDSGSSLQKVQFGDAKGQSEIIYHL